MFGRGAGAVLVWSGTSPRRLLGFFPARIERRRYGLGLPILAGWTHPFAPLGVPLVEREAAEPIIAALLAHLAADPALPGLVLLPFLTEDGPFAAALEAILRRAQMPLADFDRHQRALLAPAGDRARYVERALGRHRHKELRRPLAALERDRRRAVRHRHASPPQSPRRWKIFSRSKRAAGRAAPAPRRPQDGDLRRFMQTAMHALAAEGKVAIDRILLDGRTIAATIMLRSGRCAWFWKIAYDEEFARFSPGVMLSAVLTSELVEDTAVARTDSCATADHPMIDHLWRERLALANRLIAVRPQAPFSLVRRLEALRSAAIAGAKSVRDEHSRSSRPITQPKIQAIQPHSVFVNLKTTH